MNATLPHVMWMARRPLSILRTTDPGCVVGSLGSVHALVDQDPFVVVYAQHRIWVGAAQEGGSSPSGHASHKRVGLVRPEVEVEQSAVVASPVGLELDPQALHHVAQKLGLPQAL